MPVRGTIWNSSGRGLINIEIGTAIAFLIETAIAVKLSWLVRMIKRHYKKLRRELVIGFILC